MRAEFGKDIPVRIEVLTPQNARLTRFFFCGNSTIDAYFQQEAPEDDTAVTYLVIDDERQKLIAALTIACSAIFLKGRQAFSTLLSAIEVVYFATDCDYQGLPYRPGDERSLSHYIFSYLIEMMRSISRESVGASKLVLYAVPEARNFYRRLGFIPFQSSMYGDRGQFLDGCLPMFYNLN